MLDFTELSDDGQEFEQLIRELLFSLGYKIFWSGKGPDGGRDLLCIEETESIFMPQTRKWLIQCKHKAVSGGSVGTTDLDDIVDSCTQHDCDGYLLVTSTQPSSAVVARLEQITLNPKSSIVATYWDSVTIERKLNTVKQWRIAQRFFPKSANEWQIYASDRPNHWTANYKGYYFHITNRIGSKCEFYLSQIENKIATLEKFTESLLEKHFFRLRNVYFDDKHGTFKWYIDYMHPHDQSAAGTPEEFESWLEEEWNHFHDFEVRSYIECSDHYDADHYDYYDNYMGQFILGLQRKKA